MKSYPFVPYQFKLLQDVLVQVRKHGSSGKHLSGGERSMLSAFQEAAQKEKDLDENSFVPFYRFYDTVHTFLDGAIRRVIDRADTAASKGDGLKWVIKSTPQHLVCSPSAACPSVTSSLCRRIKRQLPVVVTVLWMVLLSCRLLKMVVVKCVFIY